VQYYFILTKEIISLLEITHHRTSQYFLKLAFCYIKLCQY